jgi:hypothetical protein
MAGAILTVGKLAKQRSSARHHVIVELVDELMQLLTRHRHRPSVRLRAGAPAPGWLSAGTACDGAGGIGGLLERMLTPRVLRAIFADELKRLDAHAREHRSA